MHACVHMYTRLHANLPAGTHAPHTLLPTHTRTHTHHIGGLLETLDMRQEMFPGVYLTEQSMADFRKREKLAMAAGANTRALAGAGLDSKGVAMPPDCQDRKNNCPDLARQRLVFQC